MRRFNPRESMQNFYLKLIKFCLLAALFIPLAVHSGFVFPFVFPKTALFQVLVEIALVAWILLIVGDRQYRPHFFQLTAALTVFLIVLFFTSLLGVDFERSFWSKYERMTGLLNQIHLFLFFLILASVFKSKKEWLKFLDVAVVASLLVSFYALGQKLGISWLIYNEASRLNSTIGNPAFLAGYLLINVFLIIWLLWQKYTRQGWRIFYVLAFVFECLIIYFTATRGALLALAGGMILLLILFLLTRPKDLTTVHPNLVRFKKYFFILLILLIVFISSVVLCKNQAWVKNSHSLNRIASISLTETTAKTRLIAWRMSWQAWTASPKAFLFGYGWENYNYVFNKYYDPEMYPTESWFDRAHNIFFDIICTSGLLGLLSYSVIFFVCFWLLWSAWRKKRTDFFSVSILFVLLLTYLIQNLFVFDMINSYLMIYLVFGLVLGTSGIIPERIPQQPKRSPSAFLISILIIVLVFGIYVFNIRPALASYQCIKGLEWRKDLNKTEEKFEQALNYGTFGRFEIRGMIGNFALEIANQENVSQNRAKAMLNMAIREGEKTVKERPFDSRQQLLLARLYIRFSEFEPNQFVLGERALEKILQFSPGRPNIYLLLGQVKAVQKEYDSAIVLLERAVVLSPTTAPEAHWYLGLIYKSLGQEEKSQQEMEEAVKLDPSYQEKIEELQK